VVRLAFRTHPQVRLSLCGLRRGEVLGLRWSDTDLKAKALTVNQARVLVDYKVRVEEPKSHNGKRTLPLDDDLMAALVELRKRQARESEVAGAAYGAVLIRARKPPSYRPNERGPDQ
jgi:integrase